MNSLQLKEVLMKVKNGEPEAGELECLLNKYLTFIAN